MVEDLIHGPVTFPNRSYDDFVIARGDGSVLYNFAVAVDDAEMGITDVIRGDDHLSNTPKQLLVLEALGHEPPRYAHLPLLHGPDGKKLSKRHGAASVQELRDAGYLPAALRNYLALLGWGTDDDTTLLSTEELVEQFCDRASRQLVGDLRREEAPLAERPLHARAAARRLHGDGRRATSAASRTSGCARPARSPGEGADAGEVWPLIRFLFEPPVDDEKAWAKVMEEGSGALLEAAARRCGGRSRSSRRRSRRRWRRCSSASTSSRASLYQPIRVAITGTTVSPGIFESLSALGRERDPGARSKRPSRA